MQLTIEELTAIISSRQSQPQDTGHPFEIGKNYFIRTVTHHHTGRLTAVYEHELVLENAAWIADDGRFSDALKSCDFDEVEPFPGPVIIGRGSIIDATQVKSIPTSQK